MPDNSDTLPSGLKVAIVHDWLVNYAGADRVVDQLARLFPGAPVYTLVYDPKAFPPHFQKYDIRTTYLQKVPGAVKHYKSMLTWMPAAFEALDMREYDLVISSCSCCSKGVITRPDTLHLCYCHTPPRYLWDFYPEYLSHSGMLKRSLMPSLTKNMRIWDRCAADRVDDFIANSAFVARRIRKYYGRDARVIYPGVHLNRSPLREPRDYYLAAGRLTHYKRFDLAVEACSRTGRRLIVAGCGEEEKSLRAMAGPTVEFRPDISDEELRELYLGAHAFLFPGEEDFGITPVEAMSAGTPVLAYGRGGVTESVDDGRSGLFFYEQTADSLCKCMDRFENSGVSLSRSAIRESTERFSEERFAEEIRSFCAERWRAHMADL